MTDPTKLETTLVSVKTDVGEFLIDYVAEHRRILGRQVLADTKVRFPQWNPHATEDQLTTYGYLYGVAKLMAELVFSVHPAPEMQEAAAQFVVAIAGQIVTERNMKVWRDAEAMGPSAGKA